MGFLFSKTNYFDKSIAIFLACGYFFSMSPPPLSRREREIMDILYASGPLTAAQVREQMPSPPGNSAVRAQLRILEEKGHIRHKERGPRYVFSPVVPRAKAQRSALSTLVQTFFGGSPEKAVAALIDDSQSQLSNDELDRLAALIRAARKKGQ